LYDLSPLAQMLLIVVGVVVLPIAWIWRRHPTLQARRHALTVLLLFVTFDLVVFGAFTRLTDSGLGCPDWPGCYGSSSPLGASQQIDQARSAMPGGPVTHSKAWIEMLHRYLASGVGALIVVLTVLAWRQRWLARSAVDSSALAVAGPWLPTLTLFWVCVQGAFGALTVTMKLYPAIVTLHLLGGLGLLMLLGLQTTRGNSIAQALPAMPRSLQRYLSLVLLMLVLQVMLGGWVSTNYAVLACQEFPKCQGQWWPAMDFRQGFEVWRALGLTASGVPIDFAALTAIHYAHRLMAYLLLALLSVSAYGLHRASWRRPAKMLAVLTALQLITGLSNVVFDWPLAAALLHTAGAAALALLLTWLVAKSSAPWTVKHVTTLP
jgi:cytochrome c oxidase assembly protein subunit 15